MNAFLEPVRLCRGCGTQGVCKVCGADHVGLNGGAVAFSLNALPEPLREFVDGQMAPLRKHPAVPKGVWR